MEGIQIFRCHMLRRFTYKIIDVLYSGIQLTWRFIPMSNLFNVVKMYTVHWILQAEKMGHRQKQWVFFSNFFSLRTRSCPKLPPRPTSMRRGGWRRLPVSASCRLPPLQVHLSISSLQHRWQSIISGSNGCQFCLIVSSYLFLSQAFKTPNHVICNQWSHRSIFLPNACTPKKGFMIHNF